MNIIKVIEEKAKKSPAKVVICEGWDERCIEAASLAMKEKLAKVVLLGSPDKIVSKARELNADINGADIVDYKNSPLKKEFAERLFELRKHKGMTIEEASLLVEDENYFSCLYALCGHADAVAGSKICSTAALMRPVLQVLRKEMQLVSEVSVMNVSNRLFFMSDLSLNIEPNAEELAQIALNAVDVAVMLDIEPKVAMLSFSTKGSGGKTAGIELVQKATALVKQKGILVDGELQADAAIHPYAAQRKCPDSPLKGEANVLIFPNLTASNISVHLLMQLAGAEFQATIMRGLKKPVAILGRSTPTAAVKNMLASLAMQVNNSR